MGLIRFLKRLPEKIAAIGGKSGAAMGWLGAGLRLLGILSPETRQKIEAPLEKLMVRMIQIEGRHADADLWKLLSMSAEAHESGLPVSVVINGVSYDFGASASYGNEFKVKWFDEFFKKPLKSLMGVLDANNDGVLDMLQYPIESSEVDLPDDIN